MIRMSPLHQAVAVAAASADYQAGYNRGLVVCGGGGGVLSGYPDAIPLPDRVKNPEDYARGYRDGQAACRAKRASARARY